MIIYNFNCLKFNCIYCNPPFNVYQKCNGLKKGGGNSLWNKFLLLLLNEMLNDDVILIMIHPNSWRKPPFRSKYNNLFKLLSHDNQMLYLCMNNILLGKKLYYYSYLKLFISSIYSFSIFNYN